MSLDQSPSKRSAVQRLNQQCTQLREQLTIVQNQKIQLLKLSKKQEGQLKVFQMKYQVIEKQLEKQKSENHRFIQAYQKEKKQRLSLATNQQSVLNNLNRDEVYLSKLTNQNKLMKEQIQALEKNLESQKSQRVSALRQKQNNNNKIKILQTKIQSTSIQLKYSKASNVQLQNQNKRLKQTINLLERKLSQKSGPLQVQTIIKDSTSTTQNLLKGFEEKIKEKQMQNKKQFQNYERKISILNARILQLESQHIQQK